MKNRMLMIVGLVAVLVGAVWTLQGSGVIGGSFMSDSPTWLVIGIIVVLAGLLLTFLSTRKRAS